MYCLQTVMAGPCALIEVQTSLPRCWSTQFLRSLPRSTNPCVVDFTLCTYLIALLCTPVNAQLLQPNSIPGEPTLDTGQFLRSSSSTPREGRLFCQTSSLGSLAATPTLIIVPIFVGARRVPYFVNEVRSPGNIISVLPELGLSSTLNLCKERQVVTCGYSLSLIARKFVSKCYRNFLAVLWTAVVCFQGQNSTILFLSWYSSQKMVKSFYTRFVEVNILLNQHVVEKNKYEQ